MYAQLGEVTTIDGITYRAIAPAGDTGYASTVTAVDPTLEKAVIPETYELTFNGQTYTCTVLYLGFESNTLKELVIPSTIVETNLKDFITTHKTPNLEKITINPSSDYWLSYNGNWLKLSEDGKKILDSIILISHATLPPSVESIEEKAFFGERNLTSVEIPEGVNSIGVYAFSLTGLFTVELPHSLKEIKQNAFSSCNNLSSVLFNASLIKIGVEAFAHCPALTDIDIPDSVIEINFRAFHECHALTSVRLPKSLKTIELMLFYNCNKLSSVVLPDSLTTIENTAFYGTALSEIKFPESLERIESYAFSNTNLKEIILPPNVSYQYDSFSNLDVFVNTTQYSAEFAKATKVYKPDDCLFENGIIYNADKTKIIHIPIKQSGTFIIPESVTEIGQYAFAFCQSIDTLICPSKTPETGYSPFESFNFDATLIAPAESIINYFYTNPYSSFHNFCTPNGKISRINDGILKYFCIEENGIAHVTGALDRRSISSITIPSRIDMTENGQTIFYAVKGIFNKAFEKCSNLTELRLLEGIEYIGDNAFDQCTALRTCNFPNSIRTIGMMAFQDCDALTEIVIPPSVTEIGNYAFLGTGLKSVKIGPNVARIGIFAFSRQNNIEEIFITSNTPPVAANNTFSNYNTPLYVVPGTIDNYKNAAPCWYRFYDFGSIREQTPVQEVKVENNNIVEAAPGSQFQISAEIVPADATLQQLFYSSTNPDVATVDNNGLVTILEPKANEDVIRTHTKAPASETEIRIYTMYSDKPAATVHIESITTGVENISIDSETNSIDYSSPYDIYRLNGISAGHNKDTLSPGFYIIVQGRKTDKLLIR